MDPSEEEQCLQICATVINKMFHNINDPRTKPNRGFVLLVFPPGYPIDGCKIISNLDSRNGMLQLLDGIIQRLTIDPEKQ